MMSKMTTGEKIFNGVNIVLILAFTLICLYPMYYVCMASLSFSNLLMAHSGLLLKPLGFSLRAYESVLRNPMVAIGFKNTFFILVCGTCFSMLMSILGAYFLSRKDVKWKNHIMVMITFTMYFSGGIIPFYLTVTGFGLDNSLWALIIPSGLNTFNLIILRTGFQTIPDELENSAKIDGAGHLRFLFSICVPLIRPTLAVILLYYAVGYWNSWFYASMFLNDRMLFPIQLVLREILIMSDTSSMTTMVSSGEVEAISETIKYAIIMIATLPILLIYPFLQKFFEKGIMIGAIKG